MDNVPDGTVRNLVMSIESRFTNVHAGAQPAPIFKMRTKAPESQRQRPNLAPKQPSPEKASSNFSPSSLQAPKTAASQTSPSVQQSKMTAIKQDSKTELSKSKPSNFFFTSTPVTAGQALQLSLGDTWDDRATLADTPSRREALETGDLSSPKRCRNNKCRIHRKGVEANAVLRCNLTRLKVLLQSEIQAAMRKKMYEEAISLDRKLKQAEDFERKREEEGEERREEAEYQAWLLTKGKKAKIAVAEEEAGGGLCLQSCTNQSEASESLF